MHYPEHASAGEEHWQRTQSALESESGDSSTEEGEGEYDPSAVKGQWSVAEDLKVVELVRKYGAKHWSLIAKHLQGRIGKQCRER